MSVNKEVDGAAHVAGKPVKRRGTRRVVMVSEVDARRIRAGEFASVEEVLHATDKSARPLAERQAKKQARQKDEGPKFSPHDQAILNELPPHFGKL